MSNRLIVYIITTVLMGISTIVFSQQHYRILSQNENGIELQFEFPDLDQQHFRSTATRIEIAGLSQNYMPGMPLLPVLAMPFALPDCRPMLQILPEMVENYPDVFPAIFYDEPNQPDVQSQNSPVMSQKPDPSLELAKEIFPSEIAALNEMGIFRDYQLTRLRVYPVQVTPGGIRFYKKFRVKINYQNGQPTARMVPAGEAELLKGVIVNGEQLHIANMQTPPVSVQGNLSSLTTAATGTRVKISVDKKGIYKITGEDLLDANINTSDIDPKTLRLTNKGKDIAISVQGDQDGVFDDIDFFEFWGERNEKTFTDIYPDLYTDPFSDRNVYWLSWGSGSGARMVEENGSIVTTRNGQFNPSLFFSHTEHIERDAHFDRFGQANQEQLSYKRDHWFFDGGIKAIGKKQYPFELIYPEETSFRPVNVRVMMSGLSFGQTLGNLQQPHDAMIWLNNAFVGKSRPDWFGQDTASINNFGNSSVRASDLVHGENALEVQLPTLPDVGDPNNPAKGTDIVLLNWFEVTYDRQYKANENYIEFKRPAFIPFPNVDLFQFEIDNFTSPEIDIYKIGVSKIINFKIDFENVQGQINYKLTFQDNVPGDNTAYVALTDAQKLKPLKIEVDRPFDPEAPERLLKSPSNAAEYVIITHGNLIESAGDLADYRRSQGVSVELIDVQDIYDEFNYGIKSPLAIQDFLRYAFFNWSRSDRLKYVLFLGAANLNYKATSAAAEDLVPTFFYQTEKFGAVATDFPYALIAGSDEIPDLFIGRLPVNTAAGVTGVTAKIMEYEQSSPKTAWRSQALFISGNDRGTYELQSQFGTRYPAFRSQNSRVIESILPNKHSAFRLNTVPDTTGGFDPNFGSTTDLIDRWDNGLFLINFMGHGGGYIWADEGLMQLPDVDRLNNKGMYPFITSMTCFTGAFENPQRPGLSQKLVLTPDKGAIAAIASSGLGYLHNDYSMLWHTGLFIFDQNRRVGEIVTLGKILYFDNGGEYNFNGDVLATQGFGTVKHEMVYQYNLIGDPYVKLQYATEDLPIELNSNTPLPGETLEVSINTTLSNADGYVELVNSKFDVVDRVPLFGVSQSTTVLLPIDADFPNGTGLVRAYLSDGTEDRSGSVRIGVNHAAVTDINFLPAEPDVDDTVQVNMRIVDGNGIQKVYLFREGVKTDTIFAVQNTADPEIFVAKLDPTFELKSVFFNVYVQNSLGNTSIIPNLSYNVTDIRPDIQLINGTLAFGGSRNVQLRIGVENVAGAGSDGNLKIRVHFADGLQNLRNANYFATAEGEIGAADSTTLQTRFPLDLNRDIFNIYALAEVDPAEDVADFNTANDTLQSLLRTEVFNIAPTANDTLTIANIYRVFFPSGSVSDSVAVRVRTVAFDAPQDQTGLLPVALRSAGNFDALEISSLQSGASFNIPYEVRVILDTSLIDLSRYNVPDVTLYEKNSPTQPWVSTQFSGDAVNREIVAQVQRNALFSPFISNDNRAPQVELSVDGRPLRESGLVSNNPSLYLLIQDESGINLQREKVQVNLNGIPVSDDKLIFPDSLQTNSILGLTVFPELAQGRHNLSVVSEDVNGNRTTAEFELVVADGFDIIVYGNYPNPFSDQTIFSYFVNLNDDLDEFEIRIYTISGRLIRRIDSDINNDPLDPDGGARRKGYNELIWDGTDKDGIEVANGVYFALLRGSYDGETLEKILKVVKLR